MDSLNQTPLFYACREGKLGVIDVLLKQGLNVNHLDSNKQAPIFYASREGHLDVVKRLAITHHANPDPIDKNG